MWRFFKRELKAEDRLSPFLIDKSDIKSETEVTWTVISSYEVSLQGLLFDFRIVQALFNIMSYLSTVCINNVLNNGC